MVAESIHSQTQNGAADERTPLIPPSAVFVQQQVRGRPSGADSAQVLPGPEQDATEDLDVPLPKIQILVLCCARIVEPLSFFLIFPFVNQMIYDTGTVREEDVGNYSGLIESLFSLTQMFVMIPWGFAADRFGRKPVLVISLCGTAITSTLFGFATSVWQMILFRCCAGAFAGTIVTVRAMFSEISTPKTRARAFSFFAFAGNFGIFVGPLIGGGLARPATEFPKIFGHVQLFKDLPYALPTMVTGVIAATAALLCAFFVEETLKQPKDGEAPQKPMSTLEILRAPGVLLVLAVFSTIMLLPLAFTAVVPVYWFTSVRLGGFGWDPRTISLFIGLGGLSQSVWLLVVFPMLQVRLGSGGVLQLCAYAWPIFFSGWPLAHYLLKAHLMPAFWIEVTIFQLIGSAVAMAFTAIQLAVNDTAPTPSTLGSLNGIALSVVCGIRAVAPALFASVYASSVKYQWLDGQLIWVVLIVLTFVYIGTLPFLPEKAKGKPVVKTSTPED